MYVGKDEFVYNWPLSGLPECISYKLHPDNFRDQASKQIRASSFHLVSTMFLNGFLWIILHNPFRSSSLQATSSFLFSSCLHLTTCHFIYFCHLSFPRSHLGLHQLTSRSEMLCCPWWGEEGCGGEGVERHVRQPQHRECLSRNYACAKHFLKSP